VTRCAFTSHPLYILNSYFENTQTVDATVVHYYELPPPLREQTEWLTSSGWEGNRHADEGTCNGSLLLGL